MSNKKNPFVIISAVVGVVSLIAGASVLISRKLKRKTVEAYIEYDGEDEQAEETTEDIAENVTETDE